MIVQAKSGKCHEFTAALLPFFLQLDCCFTAASTGEISKIPRIFCAQPANCAPIARAFLGQEAVAAQVASSSSQAVVKQ